MVEEQVPIRPFLTSTLLTLLLSHSTLATLSSSEFLKDTRHTTTSGPICTCFSLCLECTSNKFTGFPFSSPLGLSSMSLSQGICLQIPHINVYSPFLCFSSKHLTYFGHKYFTYLLSLSSQ